MGPRGVAPPLSCCCPGGRVVGRDVVGEEVVGEEHRAGARQPVGSAGGMRMQAASAAALSAASARASTTRSATRGSATR
jgi:hypothetical protein